MLPFEPRDPINVTSQGNGGSKGLVHSFLVENREGAWWGGRERGRGERGGWSCLGDPQKRSNATSIISYVHNSD